MIYKDALVKTLVLKFIFVIIAATALAQPSSSNPIDGDVNVKEGQLKGSKLRSGVYVFKGIPYAAPPVGELRWKAPQPMPFYGKRLAASFGPRPIQKSGILYEFRSKKMSEDCLYLNVWSNNVNQKKLNPVYVFIHGGSFIHGDGSQPAYDGESMAKQGIVYVSINYRLGVFGFMAHPELNKETPEGSSGNYGLLDQVAALKWIKQNISAFGGDPDRITIGGESVGSQSISAHMASPLTKGLFNGAIAQSSSFLDQRKLLISKEKAMQLGVELSEILTANNVAELRTIPAEKLLKVVSKGDPRRFKPTVDGLYLVQSPEEVFNAGAQRQVPLLVGWNAEEVPARVLFRLKRPTQKNLTAAVKRFYGPHANELLKFYQIETRDQTKQAASEIMSDYLINYGTWRFANLHAQKKGNSVYRYLYAHPHPGLSSETLEQGTIFQRLLKRLINKMITGNAFHAAEIEYALGNLDAQQNYSWKQDDYIVSAQMQGYFVNFIKTGNPNGQDVNNMTLATWPKYENGETGQLIRIAKSSQAELDKRRERFLWLQKIAQTKQTD